MTRYILAAHLPRMLPMMTNLPIWCNFDVPLFVTASTPSCEKLSENGSSMVSMPATGQGKYESDARGVEGEENEGDDGGDDDDDDDDDNDDDNDDEEEDEVLDFDEQEGARLCVQFFRETKYFYRANQDMQLGSTNRYTHAMMWRSGRDWSLEFAKRNQWFIFKKMYEECYYQNMKAASVKNIPTSGVRMVEGDNPNGFRKPFVRGLRYIRQVGSDIDVALDPSKVIYYMDSEDKEYEKENQKKGDAKEAWTTLKTTFQGNSRVMVIKFQGLRRDLGTLQMKIEESMKIFLSRVQSVVNQIGAIGDNVIDQTMVAKVLRSVALKFDHVVAAIEESKDLDTYTFDELIGSLQTHESRLFRLEESGDNKAFYMKRESSRDKGRGRNNSTRGRHNPRRGQTNPSRGRANSSRGGRGRGSRDGSSPESGKIMVSRNILVDENASWSWSMEGDNTPIAEVEEEEEEEEEEGSSEQPQAGPSTSGTANLMINPDTQARNVYI